MTTIKQSEFNFSVSTMIYEIEEVKIFNNLRLIQQTEFNKIKKLYNKCGFLSKPYNDYLWNLYYNFVINKFTFNDKKIWKEKEGKNIKEITPQHIGMRIFNQIKMA